MIRQTLLILLLFPVLVFAQEELVPLKTNQALTKISPAKRYENLEITYLLDTLELPFLDDFSKNRLHRYGNSGLLSFVDTSYFKYRADGLSFDSLFLSNDTTYSFYYSSQTQLIDTIANDQILIQEYQLIEDTAITVDSYWPAYNYYYNNGTLVFTESLTPDTVFYNEEQPIYVAYDSTARWVDNYVFINNSFGVNPPTIGVATFDGLDSLGHPYNITSANTYGLADVLTSKPINLKDKNNVVLSFYYQAQGLGNEPEREDSLVLEFLAHDTLGWKHAWSSQGDTVPGGASGPFHFVSLAVDSSYYVKGFKLRFRNYATLSGSVDQWNIDYVYLDENRTVGDSVIIDLGFKSIDGSLINTYTSMPWHQYLVNPTKYMKASYPFTLTNLSGTDLSGTNVYDIFDAKNNSLLFASNSSQTNFINFPDITQNFAFPVNGAPYNYLFTDDGDVEKTFNIRLTTHSNTIAAQEQNLDNDTVYFQQIFSSYYAYDDGSPERAYTVIGAGAKLAVGFDLEQADTLKSLLIHFPEMFELSDNSLRVMIWNEVDGKPGHINDTIYKGVYYDINYVNEDTPVDFAKFDIHREVIIPAGRFYIGFEQTFADKVYVGFDENNESEQNIFYNVDGNWINTTFTGSLMLRPDFGNAQLPQIYSTSVEEITDESDLVIYPNPTSNWLAIETPWFNYTLQITDITGSIILQQPIESTHTQLDVSYLNAGIYFITAKNNRGEIQTKRLIISR